MAVIARWAVLLAVLGFLVDAAAQVPSDAPSLDNQDSNAPSLSYQRWIQELSQQDYSARQNATIQMWKDRDGSRDAVQQAARDPDPEIAGRARWILRQWRRGALPDTPPEISRLLQDSDQPAAVEQLLEAGQFVAAVVAVEESAGTVDRELIQRRINTALLRRFPIYVRSAIQSESIGDLLELIDLVANSNEMVACRIDMMKLLSIPISDENLLPRSATTWPIAQRNEATAMLLIKLDRYDDAIQIAKDSGDESLLLNCQKIASRWREIADQQLALAKATEPGSYEHYVRYGYVLMAADRCGDQELFEESCEQMVAPEKPTVALMNAQNEKLPVAGSVRWRYLACHGKVDQALSILDRMSDEDAAQLATDSSRVMHAFDVLGFPVDQVDTELSGWIKLAMDAQRKLGNEELSPEIGRLLVLMQSLITVGRDDAAWIIAKRLSHSNLEVEYQRTYRMADYVNTSLTVTKRSDWIPRLAINPVDRSVSQESMEIVARALPEADGTTIEIVMESLGKMDPRKSTEQKFLAAFELLDGRVPQWGDGPFDFETFFETVTRPLSTRTIPGTQARTVPIYANKNVALMFSRLGEAHWGSQCLRRLAETGDTTALFMMAEQALDSGQADAAKQLFDLVYQKVESHRRAGGGEPALAVKSLIGLWTIARRAGDAEQSAELLRELRFALCSPDSATQYTLAGYFSDRDEKDLAIDVYRNLLAVKAFGSNDSVDFYKATRGFALAARTDFPDEAARWFDLAVLHSISTNDFRASAFATLPMYVHRWTLEASIDDKDEAKAKHQIDRLLSLDPLDIDLAERLLPEMRKAGMEQLADEAFDRVMDEGIRYTEKFALDAMACNNLAWVAAMNEKRLDEARQLSEMAVRVEPDSAIYRDTLAEILFLVGEREQALEIEKACLIDDPGQWHLHEQVERFSKPKH
ncbi:MAG: hypothetical protein WBD31_15970 [Rubripirellula sp.]